MKPVRKTTKSDAVPSPTPLWDFAGFLVRRLWQIHVAMFMEAVDGELTPVQFSILMVLRDRPDLDQGTLGSEIGMDRSNATEIFTRMESVGLIQRQRGTVDRRAMIMSLAPKGRKLLEQLEQRIRKTHDRLLEDLPPRDRKRFLAMLQQIVSRKNGYGRAPLRLQ